MSELKPCPFCGGKIKEVPGFNGVCGCEGDDCPGSLVEYMTLDEWNTRPIEDKLRAEIERLKSELAELRERFMVTDDLLNHATVTIGAVIACCTYNSNEDAKIGVYGISPDAFTRIDRFITRYNRAVADGKISVDVKPVTRDLSDFEIEELGAQEAEKRGEK